MPILSWAVPCPLLLSCLSERDRDGPQLPFLTLGEQQHPHLSTLSLRNVPIKVEAFPELFFDDATLPKADAM
jgi:hypothetical protein